MKPTDGLNAKQIKFAQLYAETGHGGQSVISAGYSRTGASVTSNRLLKNPKIRALVDATHAKSASRTELTISKVLEDLDEALSDAIRDNNQGARLKAIELQGKWLKMFSDSHTVQVELHNHDDRTLQQTLTSLGVVTPTAGLVLEGSNDSVRDPSKSVPEIKRVSHG
jgi:phage terminase small subunit